MEEQGFRGEAVCNMLGNEYSTRYRENVDTALLLPIGRHVLDRLWYIDRSLTLCIRDIWTLNLDHRFTEHLRSPDSVRWDVWRRVGVQHAVRWSGTHRQ
jgi:hypothetical protein